MMHGKTPAVDVSDSSKPERGLTTESNSLYRGERVKKKKKNSKRRGKRSYLLHCCCNFFDVLSAIPALEKQMEIVNYSKLAFFSLTCVRASAASLTLGQGGSTSLVGLWLEFIAHCAGAVCAERCFQRRGE